MQASAANHRYFDKSYQEEVLREINNYRVSHGLSELELVDTISKEATKALAAMKVFVFFLLLVLSPTARELTLRRLANIKERDEREEYIIGFNYHLMEDSKSKQASAGTALFDTQVLALSKPNVILLLLIWQLVVFNYSARKEQRRV